MPVSYHLNPEREHRVIMTPDLQQLNALLQLSVQELHEFIQNELLNNPVLETEEGDDGEKRNEDSVQDRGEEKDAIDWDEYLRDKGLEMQPGFKLRRSDEEAVSDYFLSRGPSLQEHLLFQLSLCSLTQTEKLIGEFLIGNINNNGYLQGDINEFSLLLGVEPVEIEALVEIIQKFDPAGVGAINLRECLLLQLAEQRNPHPLAEKIIKYHLKDIAENRLKKVAVKLHASLADVRKGVDSIRTLDPKPGRSVGDVSNVRYIIPDVTVEKVSGEYVVLVNENTIPRLTINPYYRSMLARHSREAEVCSFLRGRLDSALWLLRGIEQRRLTLFRVTESIVYMQRTFLDNGIKLLKSLTLQQLAEETGIQESTVSQVILNKYVQTPRGVFPFKFFFVT